MVRMFSLSFVLVVSSNSIFIMVVYNIIRRIGAEKMEIKKKYLMGLLAAAVLIGVVSGAFIVRYVWQVNMSMELVVSYELQLQYQYEALSSYDWGQFNPSEKKSLSCGLNYTGNVNANVTWNTVNLPSGWVLTVEEPDGEGGLVLWPAGEYHVYTPGLVTGAYISLQEFDGVPNQPETFTLNFTASEYSP